MDGNNGGKGNKRRRGKRRGNRGNNNASTTANPPEQNRNVTSNTRQQNQGNARQEKAGDRSQPGPSKQSSPCKSGASTTKENFVNPKIEKAETERNICKESREVGPSRDPRFSRVTEEKQVDVPLQRNMQRSPEIEKAKNVWNIRKESTEVGTRSHPRFNEVTEEKKVQKSGCPPNPQIEKSKNVWNIRKESTEVGTRSDPKFNEEKKVGVPFQKNTQKSGCPEGSGKETKQQEESGGQEKTVGVSQGEQGPPRTGAYTKKFSKQTKEQDEIIDPEIEKAKSEWKTPMQSKNGGCRGTKKFILSNHFEMRFTNKFPQFFYHYDVKFEPDRKWSYRQLISELCKKYNKNAIVFDGVCNLYSTTPIMLPKIPDTFELNGRPETFEVTLKEANKISTAPLRNMRERSNMQIFQTLAQCLNIVLGYALVNSERYAQCDNVYVIKNDKSIPVGRGMGMKLGLFQSVMFGSTTTFLNVHVKQKVFPLHQNLIKSIKELCNFKDYHIKELSPRQRVEVERFVRGQRIQYTDPNGRPETKVHKYFAVKLDKSAREATFTLNNENIERTVKDYFADFKRTPLEFPDLPCLSVSPAGPQRMPPRPILIPLEFCETIGGIIRDKLPDNVTSELIRIAGTAQNRQSQIKNTFTATNINNIECMNKFGITINNEFQKIESRILEPPTIVYAQNRQKNITQGSWQLTNVKLHTPASGAIIWGIINLDSSLKINYFNFINEMCKDCGSVGLMLASNPQPLVIGSCHEDKLRNAFKRMKRNQCKIVVVIISDNNTNYGDIKRMAELEEGCLTQCIKAKTINKMFSRGGNPNAKTQLICNIAMKINAKLNGTNHILQENGIKILKWPFMIMGADVIHPTSSFEHYSIATVTASFDKNAFNYNICYDDKQRAKEETITKLEYMTIQQLRHFKSKNGELPHIIVFFRDGISDGQFSITYHKEIKAVKKACTEMGRDYNPQLTFLIVQKRHNTRFFPLGPIQRDQRNPNVNIPVGTCVDTIITNPEVLTFYLLSHHSGRGLARPSKYVLLYDDRGFDIDELEELAFRLCHLLARCTKSISYPAPTYYADLAATRIRAYGEHDEIEDNELDEENVHFNFKLNNPMFFV